MAIYLFPVSRLVRFAGKATWTLWKPWERPSGGALVAIEELVQDVFQGMVDSFEVRVVRFTCSLGSSCVFTFVRARDALCKLGLAITEVSWTSCLPSLMRHWRFQE
uniref:Uncharacterized protein n=1 Tax=Noctiluca scintillans TaxID=2966 RepID=A0A7S1FBZ0_NOCSC